MKITNFLSCVQISAVGATVADDFSSEQSHVNAFLAWYEWNCRVDALPPCKSYECDNAGMRDDYTFYGHVAYVSPLKKVVAIENQENDAFLVSRSYVETLAKNWGMSLGQFVAHCKKQKGRIN
jgi:hypothetical protein